MAPAPPRSPLEALWKQPGEGKGVVTLQRMANVRLELQRAAWQDEFMLDLIQAAIPT